MSLNLHSTLSIVLAVLVVLLLFEALHFNVFLLSALLPVIMMEVLSVPVVLVMSVNPRYQIIFGAGTALLLTTHCTFLLVRSLTVSG